MAFAQYTDHRNRGVDSLEQVLATNPPTGAELGLIHSDLMWGYLEINAEKSMEHARKCIAVCIPLDGWRTVSNSYRILGLHFYGISQYDSAMVYYDKGLAAAERMRDISKYTEIDIDDCFSMIYGAIGNLYNIQGKCHEAIEYYAKVLKIFEKYDWKESQSIAYNNIGEMYLTMDNYEQAEINFLKSDTLAHQTGDTLMIASVKYHLSRLYLAIKEYDKALQNAETSHNYYVSHPEEEGENIAEGLNLLSEIYLDGFDNKARAEEYVRQALQMLETLDIPREKAESLRILSSLHFRRSEWRKAEQTALKALETDNSEPANTLVLYEILAKAYTHLGNASKSNEYIDKLKQLQSSWATKHYQSAIREMEVKYETEKKETQIASLETENQLLASEKRLIMWLGIAVLLLVAAALFLTVQKRRLALNRIKQLEQEKQLVATQALLDGETGERTRIARDLHDGLGGMLSVLRLNLDDVKSKATPVDEVAVRFDHAIGMLDASIEEMRRVAHHLMPDALSRFGLKTALTDFLNTLPDVEFNYFGNDRRIDQKLELAVYLIIHELVNNALKHASASHILVQLVQETQRLAITVEDNGCGFNIHAINSGIGISNIRNRVASFGGTIDMRSSPEKGTEANIEFQLRIKN